MLFVMAGVGFFYFWTVKSTSAPLELRGQKNDYYNLLVDGFLDGHLYMKVDPDPQLLALPPAQRPGAAPFKLDASLYRDRYYLYFGVVPVVTLYVPYALLTGHDMPEAFAAFLFMLMAFVVATAWWWEVRRRFFPRLSGFWFVVGVVVLGICTAAPSALRRPMFYEVAIGAGYAFSMSALWAMLRVFGRPGRTRWWWLFFAGVAVGLAIGARANLAPAGILFLVVSAVILARREKPGLRARWWALALIASGVGASVVGAGLAGYNVARFGRITEFGHTYQLGLVPKRLFRGENFIHNLRVYYLLPPVLNAYFPFIASADEGQKPEDYIGREQAHGEWPWTWVLVLALLAALVLFERRVPGKSSRWCDVIALPLLLFAVNFGVVALTGVRANRYMLDFHPALVLATLMVLAAALVERKVWSRVLACALLVLLPVCVVFNVLGSLQVHDFFRSTDPLNYTRLSAWADGVVWPWLRGEAAAVGDCSVEVQWPTGNRGARREPLLATGSPDARDAIFIEYDQLGRSRFVYRHGDFGELMGGWFMVAPGARVTIKIGGALLLPGVAHPWYGSRSTEERQALKRRLWVRVEGELRFDRDVLSFDSSPRLHRWGEWRDVDGKLSMFTGQMAGITFEPVNVMGLSSSGEKRGAIRLKLLLPTDRYGWVEPLLQQGGAKGFDVLAIQYVRPGFVRLLHDQLGGGGRWSEEFAVNYSQPQWLVVNLPGASDGLPWQSSSVDSSKGRPELMAVYWNGREVFRPDLPVLPADNFSLALGVNWWKASGMRAFFAGHLEEVPRLQGGWPVRAGSLFGRFSSGKILGMGYGVWLRLERADGTSASLFWQKANESSPIRLGWREGDRLTWLAWIEPGDVDVIHAHLQISAAVPADDAHRLTWLEVDVRNKGVFAHKTKFFDGQAITAWGLDKAAWQGAALGLTETSVAKPAMELPGRLRLRFRLPAGGFAGSDPLLSAGRAGAADSVFLRGDGKGHYVVGLDHWGLSAVESAPVALAPDQVHTLVVELASLAKPGELPSGRARFSLDGQVVLDVAQALYTVEPKEIVFGLNPHGMSTSNAAFRGEIVSVRTQVAADDAR